MKPAEFLHTHALFRREEFTRSLGLSGARARVPARLHLLRCGRAR